MTVDPTAPEEVVLSWSGGKDSAMALHELRRDEAFRVTHLLTTVSKDYERVSVHGVRRSLLALQAEALGLDLVEVEIPAECTHDAYEAVMTSAISSPPLAELDMHAFADLYLADVRSYRERNLGRLDKRAIFPVWGRDTKTFAREVIALGFEAVVACVDPRALSPDFAGRRFDDGFLDDLPGNVDPCGENGEFHTFVHAGPIFDRPVDVTLGERVARGGFVFQDLLPA
jgi:uncharacterized protein (TIGR00290 family)